MCMRERVTLWLSVASGARGHRRAARAAPAGPAAGPACLCVGRAVRTIRHPHTHPHMACVGVSAAGRRARKPQGAPKNKRDTASLDKARALVSMRLHASMCMQAAGASRGPAGARARRRPPPTRGGRVRARRSANFLHARNPASARARALA